MGFRRSFAAFATIGTLVVALAGCGGNKGDDELTPAERGPKNVSGQSTCVYIDSPAECKDSGVPEERWFKASDSEPQRTASQSNADHDFLMQLFLYQMMYHTWYSSPMYTDRYVVVEHRASYRNRWSSFDRNYSSRYKAYEPKASYRNTRTGKTVPGNKVNSTRFKAPSPKNNGGDRGKKVCGFFTLDGLGKASPPRPTAPKPAPPKPGTGGDRGKGGTSQHGC